MITLEQLAEYVGVSSTSGAVSDALEAGQAIVLGWLGSEKESVPESILDRAILECSSELYQRRNSPQGILQVASFDGTPIRTPLDPMIRVYPLLKPFLAGGIA